MAEKGIEQERKHALSMREREYINIMGVTEVESFDDRMVQLQTDCGELTLEGEGLHIATLDIGRGLVEVTGHINGFYYQDSTQQKKGLRARFFG
ncbi:MAG: sporulation protein YabP [Ruminococcaceae bacterium]|nr:sporulation protein YabP [Oscillospiraceae bacterium]